MYFSINYLGVSVANLSFNENNNKIIVKANSTKITQFLSDTIDNLYIINYRNAYIPISYVKKINQTKFKEDSSTTFLENQSEASYYNLINHQNTKYGVNKNTRDFFSAMYFLRNQNLLHSGSIYLDANRVPWMANYKFVKYETINTVLGKKKTFKIKLSFQKLSDQKRIKSDILTNNLVNESNFLYFWITEDQFKIPVKAEYTSSPFSTTWILTNYKA